MKVVITLLDSENGHVEITTDPPLSNLVKIAAAIRAGEQPTPAIQYALEGLTTMFSSSNRIQREQEGSARISLPDNFRMQ